MVVSHMRHTDADAFWRTTTALQVAYLEWLNTPCEDREETAKVLSDLKTCYRELGKVIRTVEKE